MRNQVITEIGNILSKISKMNAYNTDFDRFLYWSNIPDEYDYNYLIYRDTNEKYSFHNTYYQAELSLDIIAIVIETNTPAAVLGNLALDDLIKAVKIINNSGFMINLIRSHKFVETKGKTGCKIKLETKIIHRM